jgi:hypothetical protein
MTIDYSGQLVNAREAISRGDKQTAQQILADILNHDNQNIDAWLLLADVLDNPQHRIESLKRVLQISPNNVIAKRRLQEITMQERIETPRTQTPEPKQEVFSPERTAAQTKSSGHLDSDNQQKEQQRRPQPKQKKNNSLIIIVLTILISLGVICICGGVLFQSSHPSSPGNEIVAPTVVPAVIPTSQPEYLLELISMNDDRESDFITVSGQVKNISEVSLEAVEAVVEYYDSNGNFVKTDSAVIEYNPILPGQTSPFTVISTDNPAITKYDVTFKYLLDGTIPTKDDR